MEIRGVELAIEASFHRVTIYLKVPEIREKRHLGGQSTNKR
jgi:hypothetical protein